MNLNDINTGIRKNRRKKRLGRGTGSGLGKTSGRGHKGQRSRAGASFHPMFQGGAMPMFRRIPKRGFNNPHAPRVLALNVGQLERMFQAGDEVNRQTLARTALGKSRYDVLKILGDGELTKKLTISAHRFSQSARQKIEQAGGTIIELPGKQQPVKNPQNTKSARA
jgi:large subunit ribosomal protein L15